MLQTLDTNPEFEALVQQFLAEHPAIRHEWRQIRNAWSGGRTDLICHIDGDREVFASLTAGHITIGCGAESEDFEDFGRRLSDVSLAGEAFVRFVELLKVSNPDANLTVNRTRRHMPSFLRTSARRAGYLQR